MTTFCQQRRNIFSFSCVFFWIETSNSARLGTFGRISAHLGEFPPHVGRFPTRLGQFPAPPRHIPRRLAKISFAGVFVVFVVFVASLGGFCAAIALIGLSALQ